MQELDLSHKNLLAEGTISIIKEMNITNVYRFNISHNAITDHAAQYIASFFFQSSKLEELDLSYNNLQAGLINIPRMSNITNLTKLNISHNAITDNAAESLACFLSQNSNLEYLDLSYNNLQAAGAIKIAQIRNIKNLIKLNISHNAITDDAAECIAGFLSHNLKLEKLDLSFNNFCATSAIKITQVRTITNLTTFNISHNAITDDAAECIAGFLSQNLKLEKLNFSYNNFCATGAIKITQVRTITNLTKFNISHNAITDDAAECIAGFLSQNLKLEKLNFSYNNFCATGAIKITQVRTITNLTKFNISHNAITDDAAECIAGFLSQNLKLEKLDFSYNNFCGTGAIKITQVRTITNLMKLNISHNAITDDAAECIAGFLSRNSNLEELDLSSTDLQATGAIKIFQGLLVTTNLTMFNASGNNITDQAANDIANLLYQNNKLRELNLSFNDLHATGARLIFEKLTQQIINLTKLNISHNAINCEAADDIANFLFYNSDLQEVNVSHNKLYSAGITKILDGMINVSGLTKFSIGSNNIRNLAEDCIAKFLSCNVKLIELDLSYNIFINIAAILHKTRNVSNLIKCNFSCNGITDNIIDCILEFLLDNIKLEVVNLSHNCVSAKGALKIFKRMTSLRCLTSFDISHNKITDEAADIITEFLSEDPPYSGLLKSIITYCQKDEASDTATIQNTKLKELNLRCNYLSATIATKITRVTNCNLWSVRI